MTVQGHAGLGKVAWCQARGSGREGAIGKFGVCMRREVGSVVNSVVVEFFSFLAAEPSVSGSPACQSEVSRV